MNKRLALLARIVPDLHEVHAVMPDTLASRNGGLRLTFPDKRASITFLGNVNVKQPDQCSSVIGGPRDWTAHLSGGPVHARTRL